MGHWVQQPFIFKESSVAKVYQPGTEIDSKDFVFGLDPREWNGFFSKGIGSDNGHNEHVFRLDPREWNGFFSKGVESDHGHNEHVIRLDPREWDGTFSGEGKGPNNGYDDDHTIRLDPREWEGFEPAQPAEKPILESKAFDGDELLSRAFGEADPLDSSAGLSSDNATYSSNGTGSSALDTIHDLAEASIFKL